VTIKSLLLILFLCICLVWVGALYLHPGPEFLQFGLLWTAVVLIAALVLIVGARLLGWWRLWRAKAASRPAVPAKAAPTSHEDDVALAGLIAEANTALAKSPNYAGARGKTPLSGLPLYLLIGPVGAGKTSTFLNSGIEPQLLAGEANGRAPFAPTRLCNLWLAKNAVFVEFSGRTFSGDLGRWGQLLSVLRGKASVPWWRSIWREPDQGLTLRGVIGYCDVKELTGASADPQRLESNCREWQERLRSVAEAFGVEFPVYQVFTKCDKLPFFADFFGRLPESEANQVLGCTLPIRRLEPLRPTEGLAEAEAKRLTASFRPLYQSIAERRLTHLAHEPNPARRPGIYEFPRELKRIRSPLIQFLTDAFRPHPLRPVPLLRGYYLTAVREVEVAAADPAPSHEDWTSPNLGMEATRLFRGDATQIFNPDDANKAPNPFARKGMGLRWIFASDLFHQVVLADQPVQRPAPADARFERYRRGAFAGVCGICALLCLAFAISWARNRQLLQDVAVAGSADMRKQGGVVTLSELRALEGFRLQVDRLQKGEGLSYRWGLYQGNAILGPARSAYFRRFQQLLLNDLNGVILGRLQKLPATPEPNAQYDTPYNLLKTHLMISSGACKPDPGLVLRILKGARDQLNPDADPEWQPLADKQITFYASALSDGNPCRLTEDTAVRDYTRRYLQNINGVERIYGGILAKAEKAVTKRQRLEDLAPNYKQVLSGADEVSAAFTHEGWKFVEDASKKSTAGELGESCVVGSTPGFVSELKPYAGAEKPIQQRFIREYIEQWRRFVAGFSVVHYKGAADAAQKLDILAAHNSPLLALFAMTANQTDFPVTAEPSALEKLPLIGGALKKGAKATKELTTGQADATGMLSSADITRSFQPVHWVVPPGSEKWLVDKNSAYMAALAQLGLSMQDIDRSGSDPGVYQTANQNYTKALDAAKQLESGFQPVGIGALDTEVQRLLEQPILLAKPFMTGDIAKAGTDKINAELRILCGRLKNMLQKYPFQQKAQEDTNLQELTDFFAPASGAIWKFYTGSLSEFVVKEGSQWKPKDPAKKPQVTEDMLRFLNQAQVLADAFFPPSATQPQLTYVLRPKLSSEFKDSYLELEINGNVHRWTSALQQQFTWPTPPGAGNPAAFARIQGSFGYAFASGRGLWGIFRIMGDAEPRALLGKTVEWKYSRAGDGPRDPIKPGPVTLEIVQFPGGVDVFNPEFWKGLQCPLKAVQ
jgi:type VI secretion system protein ImpL